MGFLPKKWRCSLRMWTVEAVDGKLSKAIGGKDKAKAVKTAKLNSKKQKSWVISLEIAAVSHARLAATDKKHCGWENVMQATSIKGGKASTQCSDRTWNCGASNLKKLN